MNAWAEGDQVETINNDKSFEDNFVDKESGNPEFKKLEDSESYIKSLENRLNKIKKNPSVLKQLKEKREEILNNLLNNSHSIRTDQDIELDESVTSSELIRHINPAQAQTVGEIAVLIKHDTLDQQKQEDDFESVDQLAN